MGLCPKPCLGDFLRRSPLRTFKTFTARGFMSLFLRGTDFGVAVCRATNSGCSEPHSASEMRTFSLSPLPDRNGRKLVDDWGGTIYFYGECRFIPPHQSLTRQLPPKGKPFIRPCEHGEYNFGKQTKNQETSRITKATKLPNFHTPVLL